MFVFGHCFLCIDDLKNQATLLQERLFVTLSLCPFIILMSYANR